MDKAKIEEFAMELIDEIDTLGEAGVWEWSGNIDSDMKKHKDMIDWYKTKLNELLNK